MNELHTLIIYQTRYFEILEEFFNSVTGKMPQEFSTLGDFSNAVRKMGEDVKNNSDRQKPIMMAYQRFAKKLSSLYREEGAAAFKAAQSLDACKLNLGGGSRFGETQLNATRKSLLYADTVLIPDPIMPWIEKKRDEEKFLHVIPLQMTFFVLHLSDLAGEGFDIPPFVIFPSFEKILEDNDEVTQENTVQLVTEVFSHYIDSGIQSFEDIISLSDQDPNEFLGKIEASGLFISPGGVIGGGLKEEIKNYKAEMSEWRSKEWCEKNLSLDDHRIVINGIFERIQPQYHMLENSDELRSHPFVCVDGPAHYYKLISNMKNENASKEGQFDSQTVSILSSLASTRLDFLANIEDSQILELRKTDGNIKFRRELRDLVNSLPQTKLDDLGYVVSEVCAHIESSISSYEKSIKGIKGRYGAKHKHTLLVGAGTLAVTMFPVLTPFLATLLPLGGAATAGKYISDKFSESEEISQSSHSMVGVMSLAKRDADKQR